MLNMSYLRLQSQQTRFGDVTMSRDVKPTARALRTCSYMTDSNIPFV